MSFDQKMIIDATSGSMARFVNHSCSPNCEMIKWVVNGLPRMALFAGSKPIMTGDELTYDYNFAPFSNNIQKCLCGSDNCRGVLGPRPRDVKPPAAKQAKVAGKGKKGKKLKAKLLGAARSSSASPKKPTKAIPSPKSAKGGAKHTVSSVKVKKVLVATKSGSKAGKVVMKKTKVIKRGVATAQGLQKGAKSSAKRTLGRPRRLGSIDVKVPVSPPKVLFPKLKALKEAQTGPSGPGQEDAVHKGVNDSSNALDVKMKDVLKASAVAKGSPKAQKLAPGLAQPVPKALAKVIKRQRTLDAMFNKAAPSKMDKVKKPQAKPVRAKEVAAKVKKGVEGQKKMQAVKEKKKVKEASTANVAQGSNGTVAGQGSAKKTTPAAKSTSAAVKDKTAQQTPPGLIKRGPGRPRKDGSATPSPATKTQAASSAKLPGSATKTADSIEAVRTPVKSVVSTSQKTTVLTSSGRKRTLTQKSIEAAEMWDIPGAAANLKPRVSPKSAKAAQAAETPDASIQVLTEQPGTSQMQGILGLLKPV
jgi:[histone H3]-lysine4 N-trimethyltransferase ASH1L